MLHITPFLFGKFPLPTIEKIYKPQKQWQLHWYQQDIYEYDLPTWDIENKTCTCVCAHACMLHGLYMSIIGAIFFQTLFNFKRVQELGWDWNLLKHSYNILFLTCFQSTRDFCTIKDAKATYHTTFIVHSILIIPVNNNNCTSHG